MDQLDGTSIKAVEKIVKESERFKVKEINGINYASEHLVPIIHEPQMEALRINSLAGVVTYCKKSVDDIEIKECMLLIRDHHTVQLLTKAKGPGKLRECLVVSKSDVVDLPLETWMDNESFSIALSSMFEETTDRTLLQSFIGKIDISQSISLEDDGVSQKATVKKGVSGALFENKIAPSVVYLKPFRFFQGEIPQIESQFLFRMRIKGDGENTRIECGLFQSDGGAWKTKARNAIHLFLAEQLKEMVILT